MQLISYSKNDRDSYGILNGESITDLGAKLGSQYPDLQCLLAAGLDVLDNIEHTADCELSEVTLLPVIPNPGSIWCAGMNTHSHFEEAKEAMKLDEVPKTPMFFLRAAGTLVAPGQALEKPAKEPAFDYWRTRSPRPLLRLR